MKFVLKYIIPIVLITVPVIFHYTVNTEFTASEFLTFILIFLTYLYVYFTWETLEKMKQESHLERRPYIIADFTSEKSELGFYLTNIGKTPAKNVSVEIKPDIIKFNGDSLNNTIFNKSIEFFPPKKIVATTINSTFKYFEENPDQYFVKLSYADSFNTNFSEEICLDLNHHKRQSYIVEKDLKNIVESLEKINKTINKNK